MTALYNEIDDFACAWLSNLMDAGQIAPGKIDNRPIQELTPDDIRGFTQCHFFAGIGGWSYALRLAGWSDDRPVWTGSCPCQPFSSAGKQTGKADERHLWPVWHRLIQQCRPATIFGEQVSSAIAHGWLDDVCQGLEPEGYAIGAAVLPACSVGTPHKRDRLWFVANAQSTERPWHWTQQSGEQGGLADHGHVAHAYVERKSQQEGPQPEERRWPSDCGSNGHVAHTEREQAHEKQQGPEGNEGEWGADLLGGCSLDSQQILVAHANDSRPQGRELHAECSDQFSPWQGGVEWLGCPDGKQRLVKSGIPLLANGVPNRVGKLRGYGNAIVPQASAQFIGAFMELTNQREEAQD